MPTFFPKIPATLAISFSHPSLAHRYWLVVWGRVFDPARRVKDPSPHSYLIGGGLGRVFDPGQTGQRPVSTQLLNLLVVWAGSSTRARRVKDPSPHSYLTCWWCGAGSSTRPDGSKTRLHTVTYALPCRKP